MKQQVCFCTTSNRVHIAYATVGEGPVLVCAPGWVSHLELQWEEPAQRSFYETLARHHTVVLYDKHGTGLSDRNRTDFSLEAELQDLETLIEHLRLKRLALLGFSQSGPIAVAYAVKHPRRVTHLILYGTYARGDAISKDEFKASMLSLIRAHWGVGSKALADILLPGADASILEWFARWQRESATAEMAAQLLALVYQIDVADLVSRLRVPTLVIHRQRDRAVPFRLGRDLAALIPNALFVPLEGNIHLPWFGDADSVLRVIAEFLGDPVTEAVGRAPLTNLLSQRGEEAFDLLIPTSPQERERVMKQASPEGTVTILFTDIQGFTSLVEEKGDDAAYGMLKAHNELVRRALKSHGGFEVETIGDSFMIAFPSAKKAILCAIDIQKALEEYNQKHPGEEIRVRIGLNTGEPISEGEHFFGRAVNLAARVAAKAEGDEILVSELVKSLAVIEGVHYLDRGHHRLKGFKDRQRIYEVAWKDS